MQAAITLASMESFAATFRHRNHLLHDPSPLYHCRLQKPIYLFSFVTPPPSSISSPTFLKASLYPNPNTPIFQNPLKTISIGIIPTTVAALALIFLQHQNRNPRIITAPIVTIEEEQQEKFTSDLKQQNSILKKSIDYYKLKEGSITLRFIALGCRQSDLPLLKARIRSSSRGLKTARKGFQEVLGKDPRRVTKYVEIVDDMISVLKDMEVEIECSLKNKRNLDFRYHNELLATARVLELKFFEAIKDIKEEDYVVEEEEEGDEAEEEN